MDLQHSGFIHFTYSIIMCTGPELSDCKSDQKKHFKSLWKTSVMLHQYRKEEEEEYHGFRTHEGTLPGCSGVHPCSLDHSVAEASRGGDLCAAWVGQSQGWPNT